MNPLLQAFKEKRVPISARRLARVGEGRMEPEGTAGEAVRAGAEWPARGRAARTT